MAFSRFHDILDFENYSYVFVALMFGATAFILSIWMLRSYREPEIVDIFGWVIPALFRLIPLAEH